MTKAKGLLALTSALAALAGASTARAQAQSSLLYRAATPQSGLLREPLTPPSWRLYLPTHETVAALDTLDARERQRWTTPAVLDILAPDAHEEQELPGAWNVPRDTFRLRRATPWTWVGLGLGTASVGLSAVFFRLAGEQSFSLAPRQDGSARTSNSDPSTATTGASSSPSTFFGMIDNSVLSPLSHYRLQYDNLGDLTLRVGMDSLSSSLFQLLLSPSDNTTLRYLRTSVTELPGGWMFSLQGSLR